MRIVHISTYDKKGGAARSAHRLHTALAKSGVSSLMYVRRKVSDDSSVSVHRPKEEFSLGLKKYIFQRKVTRDFSVYKPMRSKEAELFSDDRAYDGLNLWQQLPDCDIINLHWVNNILDYSSFFRQAGRVKPIVWRLSDMNPFTGGCHYDEGCGRFTQGCGCCPQLGSGDKRDLSTKIFHRKKEALSYIDSSQLNIIAQSNWMGNEVKRSILLGRFPVHVIPNGIDTDTFAPRDKMFARETLGIPETDRILLFVAENPKKLRKGYDLLVDALHKMPKIQNFTLLVVGSSNYGFQEKFNCRFLGQQQDDRFLSLIYSAADVFVIPSRQDNLPNTVLESMACGTPVVGFDVGGIPDMVRPGLTGWLAKPESPESLAETLFRSLNCQAELKMFSSNARQVIEKEFSLEVQVKRYCDLYKEVLTKETF
jgi:glycosyltransferase involved in cell wall biosynthesis